MRDNKPDDWIGAFVLKCAKGCNPSMRAIIGSDGHIFLQCNHCQEIAVVYCPDEGFFPTDGHAKIHEFAPPKTEIN